MMPQNFYDHGNTILPNQLWLMLKTGDINRNEFFLLTFCHSVKNIVHRTSFNQMEKDTGMKRETISKILKGLVKKGLIKIEKYSQYYFKLVYTKHKETELIEQKKTDQLPRKGAIICPKSEQSSAPNRSNIELKELKELKEEAGKAVGPSFKNFVEKKIEQVKKGFSLRPRTNHKLVKERNVLKVISFVAGITTYDGLNGLERSILDANGGKPNLVNELNLKRFCGNIGIEFNYAMRKSREMLC